MLTADAEKNSSALKLTEVLHRVLRDYHILSDLKEAYQTIEFAKAKLILGFGGESDKAFSDFLNKNGFKIEGTFIIVPDSSS
jgi:hypothetical protein